jgi:hypothetical protein
MPFREFIGQEEQKQSVIIICQAKYIFLRLFFCMNATRKKKWNNIKYDGIGIFSNMLYYSGAINLSVLF